MKKLTLLFLSVVCVLCLAFSLTACGNTEQEHKQYAEQEHKQDSEQGAGQEPTFEEQVSQGLRYEFYKNEYTVTGIGTFGGENLVIPAEYEGVPVTAIGQRAFDSCEQLTSITLPDSITYVGNNAFDGCSFKKASIPSSLISYIPKNKLETVIIKSGKTIPDSAFDNCKSLKSVTIPNSVTSIERCAFFGCKSLTNITLPDSITSIERGAFEQCTGLTSINVSKNNKVYHSQNNCLIETASKTLMLGCKNSVIPSDGSVTSIGEIAFYFCDSLTSITIPDCVTSIGDYAFSYCENLTSVTIGNGVTSIGSYAFWGCGGLTSITLPNSVASIGEGAFTVCDKLTSITFEDTLNWYEEDKLIDVTNPSNNANNLRENYNYIWTKKK